MAKKKKKSGGCRVGWTKRKVKTGSKGKRVMRCVPKKGTKVGGKRKRRKGKKKKK